MSTVNQPVNPRWQSRWDANTPSWHFHEVNPILQTFFPTISSGVTLKGKRFLVPLCGKSIDMKWLYDQGLTVIGIEAIEKGILEFFSEQGLEFERKDYESYSVFSTKDSRLQIFQGNLFGFDETNIGKFDFFFDRGGLVAVELNEREAYIDFFAKIMKPQSVGLVEVFEYDQSLATRQPFPVSLDEIDKLYQNDFEYENIKRYTKNYTESINRNEEVVVYKITKK